MYCVKRIYNFVTFLFLIQFALPIDSLSQDFTNKGRDFWVGYGSHVRMYHSGGNDNPLNNQNMVLYFTSDRDAYVTVEIPGLSGWKRNYTVRANTVTTSEIIPKGNNGVDARLMTEGKSNKGIHITSDVPIIAYAHIYNGNQSGATLLFPTPTLGRDYYTLNYKQVSNENESYSYAFVIATEDNTDIEIIPSAKTKGDPGYPSRLKGDTIKVKLNKGEIYNILGEETSISYNNFRQIVKSTGNDLTGTRIRSVGNCKRIAVYSGSGKMSINCNNNASSSDNLIQQVLPLSTWGKKYLTVPTAGMDYNFYRILAPQAINNVRVNGTLLTNKINGLYYEVEGRTPLSIESDEPVLVAQYITSQNSCVNFSPYNFGDPEMIYLSPVEQTINRITINSTPNAFIKIHYINITIDNSSIGSLRIDGNIPSETPIPHPGDPSKVYLQVRLNEGAHTISADKGFNAIAYGYGEYESYGYNAGTSVKDLSQFIVLKNEKAEVNYPVTCTNSPFKISIVLPYLTPKLKWTSTQLFLDTVTLNPVYQQINLANGKTGYRYELDKLFSYGKVGMLPIKIYADYLDVTDPVCGTIQEIDYDVEVIQRPPSTFEIVSNGCVTDKVLFKEKEDPNIVWPNTLWEWDFGDGMKNLTKTPEHKFQQQGEKTVKLTTINQVGCVSVPSEVTFKLSNKPIPKFDLLTPSCSISDILFKDVSNMDLTTPLKWYWDFGDDRIDSSRVPGGSNEWTHIYTKAGQYDVSLKIRTETGCLSDPYELPLKVYPKLKAAVLLPKVCIDDAEAIFMDKSTLVEPDPFGGALNFSYDWKFHVGPNLYQANPVFKFPPGTNPGTFDVTQIVTSGNGCKDTLVSSYVISGNNPSSSFELDLSGSLCSNIPIKLTNKSTVPIGNITKLIINWDADGTSTMDTTILDPAGNDLVIFDYPDFADLKKDYKISLIAYSGNTCFKESTQLISINGSPIVTFDDPGEVCEEISPFTLSKAKELSGLSGGGVYTGKGTSSIDLFTPKDAGPGNHLLRYTYTTNAGCKDFKEKFITVHPTPYVDLGPDRFLLQGDSLFFDPVFKNASSYVWSPSIGLSDAAIANPIVKPLDDINYRLDVLSPYSCKTFDNVFVKILYPIKVPNTFTPNGDGYNERWEIDKIKDYPGATIDVFNALGQIVYKSIGYDKPWDGMYNGKPLPADTYYYVINPKNGRPKMMGYVTILR